MSQTHLLIIGTVWPEPNSSAAGSRLLQIIELCQKQGWRISFTTAAQESPHAVNLSSIGVNSFSCRLNHESFDAQLREINPDMVLFDRFMTEEQYGWRVRENCPNSLRILDTIDLHCLRHARHLALKEQRAFVTNDLLRHEMALREIASIYRCDISLMISELEMDILQGLFGIAPALLHYCAFMLPPVSAEAFAAFPSFEARAHFISIGNFVHEPNWDSVLHLKKNIWPGIRKKLPKAECHIYGAYATQKVLELHQQKEGFLIKGRAENVADVMSQARVCLAPLRFGAGIKGKLVDSMLYGTPNITSEIGAESMHGTLPWNGFICSKEEDFIEKAICLYQNKDLWQSAQLHGAAIINHHFAANTAGQKLMSKLQETHENLTEHRQQNFMGRLLQQHQFASNKYMALWIEAKNKAETHA
jgi:hypothetical protein